jgi:CRISPR-associated protein Csb1
MIPCLPDTADWMPLVPLAYTDLLNAVEKDSAFRRRRRLQPAGGAGDKIFPPTYPGEAGRNPAPRHVFERRHIGGQQVWCVLLDSVQSQANRMEEALLEAARAARLTLPHLLVDFSGAGLNSIGEITSLDAPHRIFDAILRDSLIGMEPLPKSLLGIQLRQATTRDATAILEASPTGLLFGAWNATGEGGGLGAKFARAIVSEIIGVDVPVDEAPAEPRTGEVEMRTAGRRTGSRIDPLGILRSVEIYKGETGWDTTERGAGKSAKRLRPSEVNHGNITPSVARLGVTCAYAEQTAVITLAGLRRLRFGDNADRDAAARSLIAALGLVALAEQDVQGYALRSRCDLVCDGPAPLEKVAFDGSVEPLTLTRESAIALYAEALAKAREVGFTFAEEPIRLTPQPKLVHIVQESMKRALADQGGEAEDGNAGD